MWKFLGLIFICFLCFSLSFRFETRGSRKSEIYTIIRKLSEMLNLRLSEGVQKGGRGRFNTHNTDKHCFRKKVYEGVILQRFSENRVFCVNRVEGGWSPSSILCGVEIIQSRGGR